MQFNQKSSSINQSKTIVCLGSGPKFKGGIANFNTSLAKTFEKFGHKVHIVSWSQQYPSIIPREFVDTDQSKDLLEDTDIQVDYLLNYNNVFTWKKTADHIISLNPDIVIIQWSIALQGLPLKSVVKKIKKQSNARIIFDLHFVIQKEASRIDKSFSRPFLKLADEYVTHSQKTTRELIDFFPEQQFSYADEDNSKRIIELYHPIYNIFEPVDDFNIGEFKQSFGLKKNVFLFFGFIRKYKGLHNTIRAFKKLEEQRDDVSLLICGESFWDTLDDSKWSTKLKKAVFGTMKKILLSDKSDEKNYQPLDLIDELGVKNVKVVNEYIPHQEVHKYFQASDAVVLFYDNSSPSGIESMSYNFSKPILATKVGHFDETIINGKNGYLAEAGNIDDMAKTMNYFIEHPIDAENIEALAEKLTWENYVQEILTDEF